MKLIIDIPEEVKETFDKADDINFCFYDYNSVIGKAIRNGTPLPKGCGRLIDAEKLTHRIKYGDVDDVMNEDWDGLYDSVMSYIENAETIIEADKEK